MDLFFETVNFLLAIAPDLSPAEQLGGCWASHTVAGYESGMVWFMASCLA